MKPLIKICGLMSIEDVRIVNEHLPDYVGFIFSKSKRKISMEHAQILCSKLHSSIKKVGVFVNEGLENVANTANMCGLNVVQLHGDEDNDYIEAIRQSVAQSTQIWKALRVKPTDTAESLLAGLHEFDKSSYIEAFLLDTWSDKGYGGNGESFDWGIIKRLKCRIDIKLVLAGGLVSDNVATAISMSGADVVDVSSGVETDGKKDGAKVKSFICSVKNV